MMPVSFARGIARRHLSLRFRSGPHWVEIHDRPGMHLDAETCARLRTDIVDLARKVIQLGGWLTDEDVDVFLAAGWERRHVLDVILAAAYKTMSNYTNHVAHTPLDPAFAKNAWSAPHATRA